jgi:N-acyl-D-amino-acid deacylase
MVHKLTAVPASIVGLRDRGSLRVGAPADVVVFDPDAVRDRADWDRPRAFASGIPWVAIGGTWVVDRGRYVGGPAGRVLRARGETDG